ncbi:MAG: NADH-quinone oxidoreductase subunit NuoE [Phycisphaerae bacterium]|nr:NADH-quinone oxidoreductase subunit NuoE [Phycisphaerae bacterium]
MKPILDKHGEAKRDALIPLLQDVQEAVGYLSREAVIEIGRHLKLPASKIYGVATFYNQFRFLPQGQHHVQVCRGTACHVKGSDMVLKAVMRHLDVEPGQTTKDGLFSLEVVACLGVCGLSPVITVDGDVYAGVTSDSVRKILASYRRKADENAPAA